MVLVSLDGVRDDPSGLAEVIRRHALDPSRWHLTSTTDESVRELSAALGVRYRRMADGSFNHSALLTVLDREGVVKGRVEGTAQGVEALAQLVVESSAAPLTDPRRSPAPSPRPR
ncbi:MAG: hypothetical protein EXR76_02680 [Myxococcales bacterium]|nr:hypothetical protein [Myxococcales bacterium]